MTLQHDAFERRAAARLAVRNQLKCIGHSLSSTLQSVLVLLAVVFVVGLRKLFIYSHLAKKVLNFIVNLTSSCMVLMMIVS